jgi:hypothetical protein
LFNGFGVVQSAPAYSDADQGKSAEGRDGKTHPAGCGCRVLNIRFLKLAHGLHLLLALPPCTVENGHSRSQSGATGYGTYKTMMAKALEAKGKRDGAGLECTSTCKDYLCPSANVNFAAFSWGRNGENPRGPKRMKAPQIDLERTLSNYEEKS